MNTYIYLVRHGEVHNPDGILYGRLPGFGLTKRGKTEIYQTADFLRNKNIDIVFSSPLLRARQTAEIIRKFLNLDKVHISKKIIEIQTAYQGIPFADLNPIQSEIYLQPKEKTDETVEQIALRMLEFIQYLTKEYNGKRIALVSHGDPVMALTAIIKKFPLRFESIRTGKYIHHGEVREIIVADNGKMKIQTVYIPDREGRIE